MFDGFVERIQELEAEQEVLGRTLEAACAHIRTLERELKLRVDYAAKVRELDIKVREQEHSYWVGREDAAKIAESYPFPAHGPSLRQDIANAIRSRS